MRTIQGQYWQFYCPNDFERKELREEHCEECGKEKMPTQNTY